VGALATRLLDPKKKITKSNQEIIVRPRVTDEKKDGALKK